MGPRLLFLLCASWCQPSHAARVQARLNVSEKSSRRALLRWGPPSCEDTAGAVARNSQPYPACKCYYKDQRVFCAGELKGPRKFDAQEIFADPACLRPVCVKEPTCDMVPGAAATESRSYMSSLIYGEAYTFPTCQCQVEGHGVYCGAVRVAERIFNATTVMQTRLCSNARCAPEPTCELIEGAEARKSEAFPSCKCSRGFNSVRCGDKMAASRKFNFHDIWKNPACLRPRCVRAGSNCTQTYKHQTEEEYVAEMRQGTGDDSFLVQMASLSNRINTLGNPVAGWALVKSWDIGDQQECSYVENVGVYKRGAYCALAFSSLARMSDLGTNFNPTTRTWCDLPEIQAGYAARLDDFVFGHRFKEFKDFLRDPRQCKAVIGVGHSMGGALMSIMAACANRKGYFHVDSLYTFGTPGVSKQQLTNALAENGCFKGYRIYNMDTTWRDPIPAVSSPFGFVHPRLREYRIKEVDGVMTVKENDCLSDHAREFPRFRSKVTNPGLHLASMYIKRLLRLPGTTRGLPDSMKEQLPGPGNELPGPTKERPSFDRARRGPRRGSLDQERKDGDAAQRPPAMGALGAVWLGVLGVALRREHG